MVPYLGLAVRRITYVPGVARAFRRENDVVVGRLTKHEVDVLRGLVADVLRLVDKDVPRNDVTARLFPDPSFDPETAEELRGLIEDDLREAKKAAARTLLASLPESGRVVLDTEAAEAWLTALNDVRLALGTAIGVTEDSYDDESDDPSLHLYHWLSFLQESLVEAVSAGLVRDR
jgi:hypothetical protein